MKKLNYFINFYNLFLSIVVVKKIIIHTNTNLYYLLHKGQYGNLSFIYI